MLLEFVNIHSIQIKSPKRFLPKQFRANDTVLMNEFIRYGFDEVDMVRLNRIRNYLKVLYVSDITESNGKKIKASIFNGLQDFRTTSDYG